MANITQDGINFNIQDNFLPGESNAGVNGKIMSNANQYFDLEDGDEISKLVNAVEIDWNGADLSSALGEKYSSINTTGQLLSWIKEDLVNLATISGNSEMIRRCLWIN